MWPPASDRRPSLPSLPPLLPHASSSDKCKRNTQSLCAGPAVVSWHPLQATWGRRSSKKNRYIYGVDTPTCPYPLTEVMTSGTGSADADRGIILGVSADSLGFRLVEVDVSNRRAIIREAVSEDAVRSRVEWEGLSGRVCLVYIHDSVAQLEGFKAKSSKLKEGAKLHAALLQLSGRDARRRYSGDSIQALLDDIRKDHGMNSTEPFELDYLVKDGRPRPLYTSTALQMGVLLSRSVPSIIDALLPVNSPSGCRDFLRSTLLARWPASHTRTHQEERSLR